MPAESPQRGISPAFEEQLLSGILAPILERVRHDDTLSLEIRNGYVVIYYRGGKLLGIHEQAGARRFAAKFDWRYCGTEKDYRPSLPEKRPEDTIATTADAREWVDAFSHYKQAMDIRFCKHPKLEREYQQSVVRDNNRHATGELSDYYIVDIEYAQSPKAVPEQIADYRFDMVGLRWPAKGRTRASKVATPVLIEMKAGDGALSSRPVSRDSDKLLPGLAKHVQDIERFLSPQDDGSESKPHFLLRTELQRMFETKQRLGLPSIPKNMRDLKVEVSDGRPEVIFIIANHHPRSTILARELQSLPPRVHADYYVATVEYAGYALFADNMIPLDDFIKRTS